MTNKPKVLLAHCDLGGAHRAVAEAISEELRGSADVWVVDLIAASSGFCNGFVRLYSSLVKRTPWFYNSIYDATSQRIVWEGLYEGVLRRRMIKRTTEIIRGLDPACVLSLFPLTSRLVTDAVGAMGAQGSIRTAVFVVDLFSIHRAWAEPAADLTMVATEEARAILASHGVAHDRIKMVRYPVRARLRRLVSQRAEPPAAAAAGSSRLSEPSAAIGPREQWGSHAAASSKARPLVLLMGGGDGVIDMVEISRRILAERDDVKVAAATGKNNRLRPALEKLASMDHERLVVSRRWSDVPGLMAAADLLVTKPGPSTIMEAIEAELPVLLTGFVPRQEEGNVRYVESTGIGTYSPERDLGDAVRRALLPHELMRRKEAAKREKGLRPGITPGDAVAQLILEPRSDSIPCDPASEDMVEYSTTYARTSPRARRYIPSTRLSR